LSENADAVQQPHTLAAEDRDLPFYTWPARGNARGVVQMLHGLAEHAGRYARFAAAANERNYTVVAHDHRGHGPACAPHRLGHFANRDGWAKVIGDVDTVRTYVRRRYRKLPLILLGHSMGSYIAQSYVMQHEHAVDGLILSGTTLPQRLPVRFGHALAWALSTLRGPTSSGALMNRLSFGSFNERFEPTRTNFDWLSRDALEVDRYVDDPLCGVNASNKLWQDLLGGLLTISRSRDFARVSDALPLLIFGGELDPVGGEERLTRLARTYERTGLADVTLNVYPNGRHEMLNEINRAEVMEDLLDWMDERF